jgi:hypothetical protein
MEAPPSRGTDLALARELVEEVLRTGLTLTDTLADLVEAVSSDAYPGEDSGEVLIAMTAGTCAPVVDAAGEAQTRQTIAMLAALRDRFMHDLRLAAELARGEPSG